MAVPYSEELHDISSGLKIDILNLAEQLEAGDVVLDYVNRRIEEIIDGFGFISALFDQDVEQRVIGLLEEALQRASDNTTQQYTRRPGPVAFDIPFAVLEDCVLSGLQASEIAARFGVSTRTIRRRLMETGLRNTDLYSNLADEDLDRIVSEIHRSHLNSGYRLMLGFLKARGVYVPVLRLRESLQRVDAEGVSMRRLRLHVLRRRQYSVPGPNSLWHIDGNHKLIKWRFVIHGGVDGFSRLLVYLNVAGNNRASTVLDSFLAAVEQYGLPSKVRSDKGGENADVAEFTITSRGTNRNSHITGRSVHNQRIERMWRDVFEQVLDLFYQLFRSLEYQGTLDPDCEVHLFALHRIFLHHIQSNLNSFKDAWNFHGLRTENNQSPLQLWERYREQGPMDIPTEVSEDYGIDWNGPFNHQVDTVTVPEIQLARDLSDEEAALLPVPGPSLSDAVGSYFETVQVLTRILEQ